MPLKHLTETILIVLLGAVIIVTGVVVASLPHLPEGFMPWAIVSFLTVVYPAVLYPLLKKTRADYAFRALHFVPFCMTIVWLLIEIIMLQDARFLAFQRVYTWGLTAPAVVLAFILIVAFCLHVIRRRVPRITFLVLLLVPFLASAYVNEHTSVRVSDRVASVLWSRFPEIAAVPSSSSSSSAVSTVAISSKGEKNLSTSSVPEEEAWRQKLRDVEAGKSHSVENVSVRSSIAGVAASSTLASPTSSAPIAVKPSESHLPKSGGEFESLALFAIAAYCGTLHVRARRRVLA